MELPIVFLARHGQTAWSLSGQHAGLSGLPLTAGGEGNAHRLGTRLRGPVSRFGEGDTALPPPGRGIGHISRWTGFDPDPHALQEDPPR